MLISPKMITQPKKKKKQPLKNQEVNKRRETLSTVKNLLRTIKKSALYDGWKTKSVKQK